MKRTRNLRSLDGIAVNLIAAGVLAVTFACGANATTATTTAAPASAVASQPLARGPSLPRTALPVPLIRQATEYSCGAAALQALLYYWQSYDGNESALYPLLNTTEEKGTEPKGIVAGAKHFGLEAEIRVGMTLADLTAALSRKETWIINIQAWRTDDKVPWKDRWNDGHYVVLVGMDSDYIYFMDPSAHAGYAYLPIPEFMDRWHDVVETAPGQMEKTQRLGILVRGKRSLTTVPGPLLRIL